MMAICRKAFGWIGRTLFLTFLMALALILWAAIILLELADCLVRWKRLVHQRDSIVHEDDRGRIVARASLSATVRPESK